MEQLNQNNNINIDIVNVDVEIVRKYINSYFNDSNEFYKSLIEKISNDIYPCYVIVPKNFNAISEVNLSSGGVFNVNSKGNQNGSGIVKVVDSSDWLSLFIYDLIKRNDLCCVFDDVMASENEINDFKSRGFLYNGDAYYYISKQMVDSDKDLLELIYATKLSWHFVCVLIECFSSNDQGESTYAHFLSKPWIPANITCSK
ncbi:hypothetical protein IFO68_16460 [Photobacterium sp. CAU 1568]|uniref:Uncharacterized protein n=1 Tax=Photobacterium arenosum TaxID=2774143 RepID=A0ABR9BNY8_9GAMM|nr:hypothetical protein [Photobacterium arenosum]MBD8514277.1 hypothetical protein [Photobacterium arenosum]